MGRDWPAAAVGPRDEETDEALRALAEPRRRAILQLVAHSELSAGEIAGCFDVTRTAVSQHLTVHKHAGLLTERRLATRRLYRPRMERMNRPNGPGDPDPPPVPAPDGWRDIRPELSSEPYVFAAGS